MTKQNRILLRNVFKQAVFLRDFGLFYFFSLRSKNYSRGFAIPAVRKETGAGTTAQTVAGDRQKRKERTMKELLTASRMAALLGCPRKHYWRYEAGLRATAEGHALRFGSAWHAAMEARWQGLAYGEALARAAEGARDFAEADLAALAGMLAGYYARYGGGAETVARLHPEQEFRLPLAGSRTFDAAGKIDGLGVLTDGRLCLVEHKTAGESVEPDSDYWQRLRFNPQVYQYVLAARALGWDVAVVLYDVARKPAIRVRQGETAEAFGDRLAADTRERPEFYFARREVPVLDQDVAEFEAQRLVLARSILSCRAESRRSRRPEHGWPRNVNPMTCRFCEFESFCMQNIGVDLAAPPAGFRAGEIHSELSAAG